MMLCAAAEKLVRAGLLIFRRCAAAAERVRAGPWEKKVLMFREEAFGASGCVVSKTYHYRSCSDSAKEYRYFATVGPRELAGKEIWSGEW